MNKNTNQEKPLRYGWTTGCCTAAAACAAWQGLTVGKHPDIISVTLPGKQRPHFPIAFAEATKNAYCCGIIKDAGDDPDVTDGVLVKCLIKRNTGLGLRFFAGDGVGTVTRAGLPLAINEPAINPKPREIIADNLRKLVGDLPMDFDLTISIPNGEAIAQKTWNPRLGIKGGLSILGTSGIVRPFSCAAWIHSIYRGIDVARANGWPLVLASTGNTSEKSAQKILNIGDENSIEMGDFAGATLKYLRCNPVPEFVIAGGIAKLTKMAQGADNLHSKYSQADFTALAKLAEDLGAKSEVIDDIAKASTCLEAFSIYPMLASGIAERIHVQHQPTLPDTRLRVMVFDRAGALIAET